MSGRIRKVIIILTSILLAIFFFFAFLLGTNSGLRIVVAVARSAVPGLKIDKARGNFLGDLALKGVKYKNSDVDFKLDTLRLSWRPRSLFSSKLHINYLFIDGLTVNQDNQADKIKSSNKSVGAKKQTSESSYFKPSFAMKLQLDDFQANHLNIMGYPIDNISIQNLKIDDKTVRGHAFANQESWQFDMNVNGSLSNYFVQSRVDSEYANVFLSGQGGVDHFELQSLKVNTLDGQIESSGKVNFSELPNWDIEVKGRRLNAGKFIKDFSTSLSFDLKSSGDKNNIKLSISKLIGNINHLPVDGKMDFNLINGELRKAFVLIKSSGGDIRFDGRTTPNVQVNWFVNLPSLGRFFPGFAGSLQTKGSIGGDFKNPSISGDIWARNLLINSYLIGTQHLTLKGNLHPDFSYRVLLSMNGFIPELGINVKPFVFEFKGDLEKVIGIGSLKTGSNSIGLRLQSEFKKKGLPTVLTIKGNDVLIMDTNQYKIYASPDLVLNLLGTNLNISGSINVPKANISPYNFSQIITLPADIKFSNEESDKKAAPFTWSLNGKLALGAKINVDVIGLKGRAKGGIDIIKKSDEDIIYADGVINLVDSTFDRYGQRLIINPGKVVYSKQDITNPNLEVNAYRTITLSAATTSSMNPSGIPTSINDGETLKVGIRVRGDVNNLKTDLYSDPAGFQNTDIMSLLVLGVPASQVSQAGQAQILLQASRFISPGGGGEVANATNKIKDTFGLTRLDIESEADLTTGSSSPSLVVGKYILPQLYVSYRVNLVDITNTFRIRYDLGKHWQVQTEASPVSSGADVFYTNDY